MVSSPVADISKYSQRIPWRLDEDANLREFVRQHGPRDWNLVAMNLQGRTGKSCRLRWINHLDPRVSKRPFTKEEEERLIAAHKLYGNRWSIISNLFTGRTSNAVKNRWNITVGRKQKQEFQERSVQDFSNSSSRSNISLAHQNATVAKPNESKPSFLYTFPVVDSTGKEGSDQRVNAPLDHSRLLDSVGDGKMKSSFMNLFDNSSSKFMEMRASSSSEQETVDEESNEGGKKKVTFFDKMISEVFSNFICDLVYPNICRLFQSLNSFRNSRLYM